MSTYCSRCATPIADSVCACGELKPVGGWPQDPLLNSWISIRFRVVRRLGRGGTSVVYLAQRYHPDGLAAVKVVLPHLKHTAWRQRLEREGAVLSRLRSPFSVRCYDQGTLRDGRLYLAMEYLRGQSLEDTLREEGRLSPERAVILTMQAAHALAEAHSLGIVHRDIKPANLFHLPGQPRERIKVLDFGIASALGPNDGGDTLLGTPRYMAPEQIATPSCGDGRADIFSLGIVLYEMVSGQRPYPDEPMMKALARRLREPPRPLETLLPPPALPARFYAVVRKMTATRIEERFQRMDGVIFALTKVLKELQSAERSESVPVEPLWAASEAGLAVA